MLKSFSSISRFSDSVHFIASYVIWNDVSVIYRSLRCKKTKVLCSDSNVFNIKGCEQVHFGSNSVSDIDLKVHFPADSHGAVIFRGAPWKPTIGRWLSRCGSISSTIDVEKYVFILLDANVPRILNLTMGVKLNQDCNCS